MALEKTGVHQLTLPFKGIVDYSINSYAVGQGNDHIFQAVSAQNASVGFFIQGPKGCGKSHLGHILAHRFQGKYLPIRRLKEIDVADDFFGQESMIIDDFHEVTDVHEELLFHLFNAIRRHQKTFFALSQVNLEHLSLKTLDLISRLKLLNALSFSAPDENLLAQILVKRFSDNEMTIDAAVVEYLMQRLPRDYSMIQRFCSDCMQEALQYKKKITIPFVSKVYQQKFNQQ
jgi:chromosomal replication initiation ATPase DnaA